jgi:Ca2+-binding RTX toxin-like protein
MTTILKATKRQTYPLINPDSGATLDTPNTAVLTIIGDDKDVAAICEDKTATIVGAGGDDALRGIREPDIIHVLGSNDLVRGERSDDIICSSTGGDRLYGGEDNDILVGSSVTITSLEKLAMLTWRAAIAAIAATSVYLPVTTRQAAVRP